MPRSAAGKAKRRRKRFDDSSSNEEEEESESEEEEKEEEKKIEDIVRTKFEGDAHRALFHMIVGKKRNRRNDGKSSESDEDEDSPPKSPPPQLKLANEPYYEEYPTPHSTQSQHDPGDANEAESQNGRPDNPQTSVSTD